MKVLVTGGSGFIGTNLMELLIARGHSVLNIDIIHPCDRSQKSYWWPVDIMDSQRVLDAFASFEPDWVVHLAGRADCDENTTVEEGYTANTIGHQNVLDAIKATPSIQRAVITSSQYVCGPGHYPKDAFDYAPATVYGQSKVISEQLTYKADLKCVWSIIRPTNIWGPWHARYRREFWKIAYKNLYFHPGGAPVVRCYGYVGNLVNHVEKILLGDADTVDKKVFYLSDLPEDIYHWANAFCHALCGRPARKVPRPILRTLGLVGDFVSFLIRKPFYITSSRVDSMTSDYLVPGWIEQTLALLGPPKFNLDEGVRQTANWFLRDRAATKQKKRVIVAGQVPPPVGGQNLMIQRTLDQLRLENIWTVEHLPLNFNTSFTRIRAFSLRKVIELFRIAFRLLKLRMKGGIDLIIYPFGGKHKMPMIRDMFLLPICFLASSKVLVWFHTGGIADEIDSLPSLFKKAYLAVFQRVNAAIVMTEFNKCDPRALGITEIHVIPHRIPDAASGETFPILHEKTRLLYLGHLYPDKGIVELLDAFDIIADRHESVELDLVGEAIAPWSDESLIAMIGNMRHYDRVKWHGLALGKEKDGLFRRASMLIFPSVAPGESFGLVLAEGLMWDLPIIATDWRGAKNVLTPNFHGRLVDSNPLTANRLANSIGDLLDHQHEWTRAQGRNRRIYLDNYSDSCKSNHLADSIQKIIEECRGTPCAGRNESGIEIRDCTERNYPVLRVSVYAADQNAFQGRSYGIMRMTSLILSVLSEQEGLDLHVISSASSLQDPRQGGSRTRFPWSTRSRFLRLFTDHIYPLLMLFKGSCDVWYFPKGFLAQLGSLCSPSVVTIHDTILQYDEDHYPNWRSSWEYRYWALKLKHTLRKANRILTVSNSSRRQIFEFMDRHEIPRKEITVTYEPCLYEAIPQPFEPMKENYVLHIASCEPHKRTAHLVRWWHEAESQGRNLPVLHLVGSVPPEVASLLASSHGIVRLPFLEDDALQAAYRSSRALILPSEIEGFGLPALEAYYLGTPVCFVKGTSVEEILGVATDKGGFSLDDPETLASALDDVLRMSPEEIRTCGLKLRGIYAAEKVAERMLSVFREVKTR